MPHVVIQPQYHSFRKLRIGKTLIGKILVQATLQDRLDLCRICVQ